VQNVADYLEVMQLIARYARALDTHDAEAEANCFIRDGVHVARTKDGAQVVAAVQGREALKAAAQKRAASAKPDARGRHNIINPLIELDGDRGVVQAYYLGTTNRESGVTVNTTGEYRITLRKEDGKWKFAERASILDFAPKAHLAELAQAGTGAATTPR